MGILNNEFLHISVYWTINKSQLTTYRSRALIYKAMSTGLIWSVKHGAPHPRVFSLLPGAGLQLWVWSSHFTYSQSRPTAERTPISPSSKHHSPEGPFLPFTVHCYPRDQQTIIIVQIKLNWTTAVLHLHTVHIPPSTAELNSHHRNHVALKTSNMCSLAL